MRVAIRNPHHGTLANPLPFYNYIRGLLRSGTVTHFFFEGASLSDPAWRRILARYSWEDLGLDHIRCIFSSEELNRECDVLISLDSQPRDFSPAVKAFPGIKIYHLMDYFWGEPLSQKAARLKEHGVDFVMSYASPDRYDPYFIKHAPEYVGKVIPVPFGFGPRFASHTPFDQRQKRCVALGSVRPLRFPQEPERLYKEQADFFGHEQWFHKFRRMLVEHRGQLDDVMDSLLPEFPRYRDYDYDLAGVFNQYQLFVSDESLFFFPSAKTFEGPASGTVMVCSTHPSFSDLGFVDGVNCLMHREFDIEDFHQKVRGALQNQSQLRDIAARGKQLARSRFDEKTVGLKLASIIKALAESPEAVSDDLADYCYKVYRDEHCPPELPAQPSGLGRAFAAAGALYRAAFYVSALPGRIIGKLLRTVRGAKVYLWKKRREFLNADSLSEELARRRFLAKHRPTALPRPSQHEQILIKELRDELQALPAPNVLELSGPARKWVLFVLELRRFISQDDPRNFLSWNVITNNMLYRADARDMAALRDDQDWERWRTALAEPQTTRRQPFYLIPEANENSVRQAVHLLTLSKVANRRVGDFDTVVDFGGGFGSMCRLVRKLGFKGRYIIFDWKEFSALQRFYLKLAGEQPPIAANSVDELRAQLGSHPGRTLLLATWSLSESPTALREEIWNAVHPHAALIAYQKDFGGVDNERYFKEFALKRPELSWKELPMHYLPTERNAYLIGWREQV
jgi:hypothetical protein